MTRRGYWVCALLLLGGVLTAAEVPRDLALRVNPLAGKNAKKGGTIRLNSVPPKSQNGYTDNNVYTRMTFELMYESMLGMDPMTMDVMPGLAKAWEVSADGREFVFEMDARARWSDGERVTAEDVKWTFDVVMDAKNDTGVWKVMLGGFESPVVEGEKVVFRKKGEAVRNWRDLITLGGFPILPRHRLEGKDFNRLDFVGEVVSGPYELARVEEQVEAEWRRQGAWWRGGFEAYRNVYNFDRIILRYYIDNENAFEALKAQAIDVYPVYTARIMAQETYGEKFEKNWLLKRRVRNHAPIGFQGFAMNMRRFPFDDVRVRKAMAMLIDRETMNRTMMSNAYFLLRSYFTDLYDGEHVCTNELWRYDVGAAQELLAQAGFRRNAEGILEKDGKEFSFTFLSRSSTEDKFLALFDHALRACGIRMAIVRKDFAGWMRDMDGFNFDMTWAAWGAGTIKEPEAMWLSSEADRKGSNNITGFKSAAVDELIRREKTMADMATRNAAYREIDARLAAEVPYALLWHVDETRLIYWNKFGMPPTCLDRFSGEEAVLTYWWYDEDRAAELKEARAKKTCLPNVPERVNFDEEVQRK
jgi:microcin C transport system substrate-binding protein